MTQNPLKMALSVSLLLLCLLLAGCGFHLRGQGFDLKDSKVWLLTNNPHANFERSLRHRLKIQGAQMVSSAADSTLQLAIESYQLEKRVVARDSDGRASENELILQLNYQLLGKSAAEQLRPSMVKAQNMHARRDYAYDRNIASGQASEERRLVEDMEQELIGRLLLQMAKVR